MKLNDLKVFLHTRSIDHSCERSHFSFFLKQYLLAVAVNKLINQAFYEGKYPNCLKLIKLIFKTVSKTFQGNYMQFNSYEINLKKLEAIYSSSY